MAGDDVGNVMWMREKWRELVGKLYGNEQPSAAPEGMDEVVAEVKQIHSLRAKRAPPFQSLAIDFASILCSQQSSPFHVPRWASCIICMLLH